MAAKYCCDRSMVPQTTAFVMQVGPGAAIGFYVALVGFYVANFQSRIFFLAMVFCMYLPAPVLWLLQQRFDAWFDAKYGAQASFNFRVVGMLVLLMLLTMCWAASSQTPYLVLAVGFGIAVCSHAIFSSSNQLVGSLDPSLTRFTTFGRLAGSALPVAVVILYGFSPTSDLWRFQMVVATVPAICLFCACFLVYINFTQDVFEATYERLTSDSFRELASRNELFFDTSANPRQKSEPGMVPLWVWLWCGYNSFSVCCTTSVMALTAFFGNPVMAQTLGLSKLFVDLIGAAAVVQLSNTEYCLEEPWHNFMIICGAVRTCLFGALMFHLGGIELSDATLLCVWVLFHSIHAVTNPYAAATVAAPVDISDRRRVLRVFLGCKESGALVGLLLAAAVLVPAFNLGRHWPASGHHISMIQW